MNDVESRLLKLERTNRRWRYATMILATVIVALFAMGQTRPAARVLEIDQVIVRDDAGKVRLCIGRYPGAREGMRPEDFGLILNNDEGNVCGGFVMRENTPEIALLASEKDELASALRTAAVMSKVAADQAAATRPSDAAKILRDYTVIGKNQGRCAVTISPQQLRMWRLPENDLGAKFKWASSLYPTGLNITPDNLTYQELDSAKAVLNGKASIFEGSKRRTVLGSESFVVSRGVEGQTDKGACVSPTGVTIVDAQKLRAVLGEAETENKKTGATTRHPASTLTLFGEDGTVLYQAPR